MSIHIHEKIIMRTVYILAMIFTSCAFYNGDTVVPSFAYGHIAFKIIIIVLLMVTVTYITCVTEHDADFAGKAVMILMPLSALMYFVLNAIPAFAATAGLGGDFLHFVYTTIAFFSVLLTIWCTTVRKKTDDKAFTRFYNRFFTGLVPLYAVIFIVVFFTSRNYVSYSNTVNLIPFQGEIKYFASEATGNIYSFLRTPGNILFFAIIPLIIHRFSGKKANALDIVIPLCMSVGVEAFQYFTNCGDTDIDDVILNSLGAVIGIIIYHKLIKKHISEG